MSAPTVRSAVNAAAITMGLHASCTVAMVVPALLAPVAAADFGVDPSRVGVLVAFIYFGTLPASLACGLILERISDLRAAQLSGWLCALGMLLVALAGWTAAATAGEGVVRSFAAVALFGSLLMAGGLVLGFGYGMLNPVGSQILFRATPPEIRSMVYSVKQSSVPIGQMVAGFGLPLLLLLLAWQWEVLVVAAMISAYVFAMIWMRVDSPPLAPPLRRDWRALLGAFVEPARAAWATPSFRELAVVGALYSANQLCLLSFLVSYLNLEIGISLVLAGTLFAAAQAGGMIGRLTWGFVADRWVTPRVQVGALGIVGGVCGFLTAAFSPAWPVAVIATVSVVYGATAVSWNGVYFAEVARLCPRDEVGRMTGGLQFYMSLGGGMGPLLFSALVGAIGTYSVGFAVFALPALLMGMRLVFKPVAQQP